MRKGIILSNENRSGIWAGMQEAKQSYRTLPPSLCSKNSADQRLFPPEILWEGLGVSWVLMHDQIFKARMVIAISVNMPLYISGHLAWDRF